MPDLIIPDDGFVEIVIGSKSQKFDVYRVYNQLLGCDREARAESPGEDAVDARQVAYLDKVCEVLKGYGFEGVSHRAADKFDDAICKASDALGKVDGTEPMPDSPESTASVPSA